MPLAIKECKLACWKLVQSKDTDYTATKTIVKRLPQYQGALRVLDKRLCPTFVIGALLPLDLTVNIDVY